MTPRQRLSRWIAWVGLVLGSALLALRFVVTMQDRLAAGDGPVEAAIFYFSFFTILTNLGLVLAYFSELFGRPAWFGRQWVRSMLVVLILVVMGAYHLLIAGNYNLEGPVRIADMGTHYVTPPLFLAWWLLAERRERPVAANVPRMVVPPMLYAAYMLLRGAITGFYPYPFLDPTRLEPAALAINLAAFAGIMATLFLMATAVDRMLWRSTR